MGYRPSDGLRREERAQLFVGELEMIRGQTARYESMEILTFNVLPNVREDRSVWPSQVIQPF